MLACTPVRHGRSLSWQIGTTITPAPRYHRLGSSSLGVFASARSDKPPSLTTEGSTTLYQQGPGQRPTEGPLCRSPRAAGCQAVAPRAISEPVVRRVRRGVAKEASCRQKPRHYVAQHPPITLAASGRVADRAVHWHSARATQARSPGRCKTRFRKGETPPLSPTADLIGCRGKPSNIIYLASYFVATHPPSSNTGRIS